MTAVIDNGSGLFKAGWATDDAPIVMTDPTVNKLRDRHTAVNTVHVGYLGGQRARTPFDDGVVISSDLMETIFDYGFINLGATPDNLERVVLTEPATNPPLSRAIVQELMYEAYNVPELAIGVDGLLSLYRNAPNAFPATPTPNHMAVAVSVGHSSTTVIPVDPSGSPDFSAAQRLSVGWEKLHGYMQHLVQTKYWDFPHIFGFRDHEDFIRHHCYVAQSFPAELHRLLADPAADVVVQYPVTSTHTQAILERVTLTAEEQAKLAADRPKWIAELVSARAKLAEKANRQSAGSAARKKSETATRMRVMASLLDEDEEDTGKGRRRKRARATEDRFGDDTAGWQVYTSLSKDSPDDIDDDASAALARLDRLLAEYDPLRLHRVRDQTTVLHRLSRGAPIAPDTPDDERFLRAHQVRLNVERVRVPEALFHPSLVGVDEAGLQDLVLSAVQAAFSLDVRRAADPVVDAWRGAATAPVAYVSRAEYFEHGAGWFRDHRFGNPAEW
ncbi:Nuclear actin-protein involved in chromatin remodeling [Blastocladiella emersonii ATCC 22665]|nr:Nuclear actin-protein involved in chromatin remodeling [Blastocladiella emersonii ATCC 22665]